MELKRIKEHANCKAKGTCPQVRAIRVQSAAVQLYLEVINKLEIEQRAGPVVLFWILVGLQNGCPETQ